MNHLQRCFFPGELLIPANPAQFETWACVACDQFTSQPEYWEQADALVGANPSALRLILPECYLGEAEARVPRIHERMQAYLREGALAPAVENGFILVERETSGGARLGLVGLLDLESYDYHKGARSPVRATEETIESRIPPRLAVRRGAAMELSHVLMLVDDPEHGLLEPLYERRERLKKVYDFPLMLDGGRLAGYAVTEQADIEAVHGALDRLLARSDADDPLLFAVGDGNHSLATAKAYWEELKRGLSPKEAASHPARYAMVEVENIHDAAMRFEPIHRVLFGCDAQAALEDFAAFLEEKGAALTEAGAQEIVCVSGDGDTSLRIGGSPYKLAVGTLQAFLDGWLKGHPGVRLDYVHGEDAVRALVAAEGATGFLLPTPAKDALFETVLKEGALPRKTFSMGEANEKRYYMEARRLLEGA